MLRQLAASFRPLLIRNQLAGQVQSSIAVQHIHSTPSAAGLEEFFELPLQEGDKARTGNGFKPSWHATVSTGSAIAMSGSIPAVEQSLHTLGQDVQATHFAAAST